jgi:threonine/homoserine/homoserine lactone efflux protein
MRNYAITMSVRMACFGLAVVITPYAWYTWVFAFGAIFLPYFAVVIANATRPSRGDQATAPTIALTTASTEAPTQRDVEVITIPEANQ